jgi:CRP-like cAMP-binding protein
VTQDYEPIPSAPASDHRLNDVLPKYFLSTAGRVEHWDRHAFISREGRPSENVHILVSGAAYSHRRAINGARAILALYLPGDVLDLAGSGHHFSLCDTQAIGPSQTAFVSRSTLLRAAREHTAIATSLWSLTARSASILSQWLMKVGRSDARARISHLICEIAVRLGAGND